MENEELHQTLRECLDGFPDCLRHIFVMRDFENESTELIYEKLKHLVDIVIDSGFIGVKPSTIVDCTTSNFEIIRQGKGDLIL